MLLTVAGASVEEQGHGVAVQGQDETLDSICGIRVLQKRTGFRFSVDAPVLADFAARDPVTGERRRLGRTADLCTGCGVIGLLLARAGAEHVLALDIQAEMDDLARRNAGLNGLAALMETRLMDVRRFRELSAESFDLVVTNPPFHSACNRIPPDHARALATHELECTINDVLAAGRWLLKPGGRLALIYPAERAPELFVAAGEHHLSPRALRPVYPRPDVAAHALLWELVPGKLAPTVRVLPALFLRDAGGRDTPELSRILSA
jgi:tRNA1Val (adenine37-N6)-methyltransferase